MCLPIRILFYAAFSLSHCMARCCAVNTTAIAVGFTVAYTLPFTACIEVKGALVLPTLQYVHSCMA